MLLAIDIGNSTLGCGVFEGVAMRAHWSLPSDSGRSVDDYGRHLVEGLRTAGITPARITDAALSSVVPALTSVIQRAVTSFFRVTPLVASADLDTGLTLRYTDPCELGVDRLVAAAWAHARYRGPIVIVDLGTATTFSVVSGAGEFLGGAIAPGLGISADALASRTARLPRVELASPPTVIGQDTRSSIQSGLLFGHAALVDGMVERIQGEVSQEIAARATVIATGGLASVVAPLCRTINHVHPHLTLEGLAWLFRRLRQKER